MSHRLPEADAPANPFCTRRIRPGAIPFWFSAGEDPAGLIGRFQRAAWRGAIIGPHGSGKSTLLAALLPALKQRGMHVAAVGLHDGQRRLPSGFAATLDAQATVDAELSTQHASKTNTLDQPCARPGPALVVVIDGYEQLGRLSRCRLRWLCWRRRLGLLVTSHGPVGLPVLFRTGVDLALAQHIVAELQKGFDVHIDANDVARLFPRYGGNLRELLFGLYDLYEGRQRKSE